MLTSTLRLQRITNALHYAAIENHEDVFQLLLEASIDISKRDYSGVTAFDYAFSPSTKRFTRQIKYFSQSIVAASIALSDIRLYYESCQSEKHFDFVIDDNI